MIILQKLQSPLSYHDNFRRNILLHFALEQVKLPFYSIIFLSSKSFKVVLSFMLSY